MRNKLRYTAQETTNNLFTTGKEWMFENNVEYVGAYHRYADNLVMTGGTYDAIQSKKLIPYVDVINNKLTQTYKILKPTIKLQYQTPRPYRPIIDITKLTSDYIYRYFLKRFDEYFIEIDQDQYDLFLQNKIDPSLYKGYKLQWTVRGNSSDIYQYGSVKYSIASLNRKSVSTAEQQIPGISNIITNYTEFAVDTTYTVPKDINS